MTFDEFMRYVRLLGNSCWVRYYLHWNAHWDSKLGLQPMVLEIASPETHADFNQLRKDLAEKGFTAMDGDYYRGWALMRWSVPRVERAEGGQP